MLSFRYTNEKLEGKSNLIEEINVDFLKAVHRAELVEFVMDFVEDQRLVVVGRVVANDVVDRL